MDVSQNSSIGSLRISQDVIATIASHTASSVEGVASMAFAPTNIRRFFVKNIPNSQSVKFTYNEDTAVIDIYVNLKYGAKIQSVAEKIQQNVKDAVQGMTSVAISEVNVHVENIVFEDGQSK